MIKKAKDIKIGDFVTGLYGPFGMTPKAGGFRRVKHIAVYPDMDESDGIEKDHFVFSVDTGQGMYMVPEDQDIEVQDES